jgi:transcriptional regulator with XRE-family HTH domain
MRETTVQPNGRKIREIRMAKKLTQAELAQLVGCNKRTVENAEAGKRIKEFLFKCIATVLGVELSELLEKFDGCYYGRGRFGELRALDDEGRVGKLTRRCYYGEFENATLTIRGTDADLVIDNVTMYDDPSCSERFERSSHRLEGHGTVVDGSINIQYTAEDQTRRRSWAGVCVLNFPRTGMIHGYWMSAGHAERGRTVLGTLELELEPT